MAMQPYNFNRMFDMFENKGILSPLTHSLLSLYSPYDSHKVASKLYDYPMDVVEHDTHFDIIADCPGLSEDNISIETNNGYITIAGEKSSVSEKKTANGKVHHKERTFTKFNRSFKLPENVDEDDITAVLDKGILNVKLNKVAVQPHKTNKVKVVSSQ
jgi:HSP20 family protein